VAVAARRQRPKPVQQQRGRAAVVVHPIRREAVVMVHFRLAASHNVFGAFSIQIHEPGEIVAPDVAAHEEVINVDSSSDDDSELGD